MGLHLSGSPTRLTGCKGADGPVAQTLAAARASRKRIRGRVRLEFRSAKENFQHSVENSSELVTVAFDGNEERVVELLCGWMNPNSKTEDDKIALHMALAQGQTSAVRQLLIFKADILLKQEVGAKNALDIGIELAMRIQLGNRSNCTSAL